MIPDFQSIMLPLMRAVSDKNRYRAGEIISILSDQFQLSEEERLARLPSGRQSVMFNRVHWAITYLVKCGLLVRPARGVVQITERGQQVLAEHPERIDLRYLSRYPELDEFRRQSERKTDLARSADESGVGSANDLTPDERLRSAHDEINAALKNELLARVLSQSAEFFEQLVVDLLIAMGFGGKSSAGQRIGRSGDGGLDGVISQDALGIDQVYVQAKKWQTGNIVGSPDIRNFFGSLDAMKASKGVFITTSSFSKEAIATADRLTKKIVLIDGERLSDLMLAYDVGVSTAETFHIKKIDEDFFTQDA